MLQPVRSGLGAGVPAAGGGLSLIAVVFPPRYDRSAGAAAAIAAAGAAGAGAATCGAVAEGVAAAEDQSDVLRSEFP